MNAFQEMKQEIQEFFHSSRLTKTMMWIMVALFPFYITVMANALSYGSGELLHTLVFQNTGSFVFGLILVSLVFIAFLCLIPHVALASGLTGILVLLLSLVDYFKFAILKEHFLPWDLLLAQNAASFTEFLGTILIPHSLWEILISTLFYCTLLFLMGPKLPWKWRYRAVICPVSLGLLYTFVGTDAFRNSYESLFGISVEENTDQSTLYKENGFLTAFALNFGSLNLSEPQNYSLGYMQHAFADYLPNPASGEDFQNPDIIVVLSEAFWDPTVLNGVTFEPDPLGNFRAIAAEHPSGKMISPTFGGGTVRPEFEILSGLTTSALPTGNIPYQQYVKNDITTYARHYKNLGYDTLGIHTYQKTFYERDRAYPLMGFDDFLGEYDFHAELHWNSGPYITDETIAEEIIWQLEQPHETGLFLMAITMENHSMYQEKYDPADWDIKVSGDNLSQAQIVTLQNYAKGISDSDNALQTIYDYIQQREKPTAVLWYGDHLPTLGDDFDPYTTTGNITSPVAAEWTDHEKYTMFSTPYLIFTNYDTGRDYYAQEEEPLSPYLLPALMADYIGAPETLETNFLLDLYSASPVISKYYDLYSPNGDVSKREELRELHELMTYDRLIGKNYFAQLQ